MKCQIQWKVQMKIHENHYMKYIEKSMKMSCLCWAQDSKSLEHVEHVDSTKKQPGKPNGSTLLIKQALSQCHNGWQLPEAPGQLVEIPSWTKHQFMVSHMAWRDDACKNHSMFRGDLVVWWQKNQINVKLSSQSYLKYISTHIILSYIWSYRYPSFFPNIFVFHSKKITKKSTKIPQNPRFFIPSHPFPRPAMADVADPAETAGDHIAAGGATPTTSAPSAAVEDDVVEAEESPTNPQEKPTEAPSWNVLSHVLSHALKCLVSNISNMVNGGLMDG